MKSMPENSVDTCITDPPYELGFMGKKWDSSGIAFQPDTWAEVYRLLKPGGLLLAFGGTRTYHRMVCAIEDAGFEIRDTIAWVYGSGFPKSYDISKGIDKQAGKEPVVIGKRTDGRYAYHFQDGNNQFVNAENNQRKEVDSKIGLITAPATPEAQQWDGWGTALKPANEPICLARKPLSEKTIVENVLKWGTGGINIDDCRIELNGEIVPINMLEDWSGFGELKRPDYKPTQNTQGRFPANVIMDEEAGRLLDEQSGERTGCKPHYVKASDDAIANAKSKGWGTITAPDKFAGFDDKGGASRFFYTAKASRRERNAGLDSYVTMKYNMDKSILGGLSWKDVSTVAVQLLKRATSDMEAVSFSIGESGESITAQCHKDSLSIISTEISKIIESKILNSLMPSRISEFIVDANYVMENGGNHVMSVENSSQSQMNSGISQERATLLMDAVKNVISELLLRINEEGTWKDASNFHSTVKPVSLMRYLCRLITPPNGTVLDPFMGSGTTGCAATLEGFDFIGIEQDAEYIEIARRRIEYWGKDGH